MIKRIKKYYKEIRVDTSIKSNVIKQLKNKWTKELESLAGTASVRPYRSLAALGPYHLKITIEGQIITINSIKNIITDPIEVGIILNRVLKNNDIRKITIKSDDYINLIMFNKAPLDLVLDLHVPNLYLFMKTIKSVLLRNIKILYNGREIDVKVLVKEQLW